MRFPNPFRTNRDTATTDSCPGRSRPKGLSGKVLQAAVERALTVQQPLVASHVARIRRTNPGAAPTGVITTLNKQYLLCSRSLKIPTLAP